MATIQLNKSNYNAFICSRIGNGAMKITRDIKTGKTNVATLSAMNGIPVEERRFAPVIVACKRMMEELGGQFSGYNVTKAVEECVSDQEIRHAVYVAANLYGEKTFPLPTEIK